MTDKIKKYPAISFLAAVAIIALVGFYFFDAGTATAEDAAADSADAQDSAEATDDEATDEEGEEKDEKAPIPVETTEVATGRVASYISATANLVPENEVRVLAEWEGRVAAFHAEEGDYVEKGQVLVALDPQDGEIALSKARIKANTNRLAYERAESLKQQELLSSEDFDKISLDSEIARQELAEAEWRLEKTQIRAPFSGRVTQRMVQPGQHVRPGDELFTVADFEPLIARIYLPERDVLALEEGREVRILPKADEALAFSGRIRQISPVVDTATGTVKVTVEARSVPRKVRPGAFVRVDVVREAIADAVLVPKDALVRELQKAYVFVAEDGVAHKRAVSLGIEEDEQVQATDGVAAGEQVVIAGQGGLKDGSKVKRIADGDDAATAP